MSTHSPIPFSAADRWHHCQGSRREIGDARSPSSVYAKDGSGAHALAEWCLRNEKNAADYLSAYINIAEDVGQDHDDITVSDDMKTAVQIYLDYVRQRRAELRTLYGSCELIIESRADCTTIDSELYGTMDACLLVPFTVAEVIDYKHGQGKSVEATSLQLEGYALAPWLSHEVPRVISTIVQPRAPHDDGPIRSHEFSAEQLATNAKRWKAAAAATRDPQARLTAGPWCSGTWCPKRATCPALRDRAVGVAQVEFARDAVPPKPQDLTPEQLGKTLDLLDILEGWAEAVRVYALAQGMAGNPPPNRKVVEGRRGARRWVNDDAAAKALQAAGIADPYERSVFSVAVAEKELGKPVFKTLDGALITQPPGKPQLVPLSDKRPALPASATLDFQPVEQDTL